MFMIQEEKMARHLPLPILLVQQEKNIKIITQPPLGNGTEVLASLCTITFTKK